METQGSNLTPGLPEKRNYWKPEEENILREWADKSQVYELFHGKGHLIYKKKNARYVIPVIIISTLTGTANFAQERVPVDYQNVFVMIIGSLSIIAAIISTISQFLRISELNEAHRVASLSWGKFSRNAKTDLAKHPLDRGDPVMTLKVAKEEFNRLLEISPIIPKNVIANFNVKFEDVPELAKPEICDSIIPTTIFYMTPEERTEMINSFKPLSHVVVHMEDETVTKFKQTFFKAHNRYPTEDEIKESLAHLQTGETDI